MVSVGGKSRFGLLLVLLLAASSFSQLSHANEGVAKAWLETMSFALRQLSYEGVFVYRRGDQLAAMHVRHITGVDGEFELISTLTGEARELTRSTGDQFQAFTAQGSGVSGQYELSLGLQDRVAGRNSQVLNILPKDEYRYGYRLWLDADSGLLLKSDLVDLDGRILEQVMFTSLEILEQGAKAPKGKVSTPPPAAKIVESSWKISEIPQGFELIEVKPAAANRGVEHLIYSDGLASVSVFIESKLSAEHFDGVSNMGAVNAFGATREGHQLTVVGEVPAATVSLIGRALSPVARQ